MSPGHSGKVRFALHLALPMSYRVTYDQLRKKDVSPSNRSIMKKQAHYTPDTPIKASAQAAGYLREDFRDLDHEESWILLLNGAHLPLAKKMITVGTIKSTQIDHRRIIKEALLCNATAIILFHNHPSGNPAPSASDMNETNKLKKACDIFDISLLDHIILSDNSYYSFAEETQNKF
jgi:DNA repair protein RadC